MHRHRKEILRKEITSLRDGIGIADEELDSLKELLMPKDNSKPFRRRNKLDEIVPGLFIGDCSAATSFECLHLLGITHVLNAAEGIDCNQIMTGHCFYDGSHITYHGIAADDDDTYDLGRHFDEASNFIKGAIGTKQYRKENAKILVHCMAGVSRSATFATAYLMRDHQLNLKDALSTVSQARFIYPNDGFLKCLINYNKELGYDTK